MELLQRQGYSSADKSRQNNDFVLQRLGKQDQHNVNESIARTIEVNTEEQHHLDLSYRGSALINLGQQISFLATGYSHTEVDIGAASYLSI